MRACADKQIHPPLKFEKFHTLLSTCPIGKCDVLFFTKFVTFDWEIGVKKEKSEKIVRIIVGVSK